MLATIEARKSEPIDDSVVAPLKPSHRADVQGLRAIAVVLVVLYHAGFGFSGGFVGVDAFFVLSGFVITRRLRWEVASTGTIDLLDFLQRRIVRILPAASLMTVVTLLATSIFGPMTGQPAALSTALSAVAFNANNYLALTAANAGSYFDPATDLNPFLHMWSLSVEEQFYLVFPIIVLVVAWFAKRRGLRPQTTLLAVFGFLLVVSFVASLVAIGSNQTFAFYLAPFRAWEFLVGALLVWSERIRWGSVAAWMFSATGAAMLVGSGWFFVEGESFPGVLALVPVLGTAFLISGGSGVTTSFQRVLSHRSPGFFGRTSYAWYLWHWPLIVFAKASFPNSTVAIVLSLVLSLGIATASTASFEEPIRNRRWTRTATVRLAIACTALSFFGFLGAETIVRMTQQTASMGNYDEAFRSPGPEASICTTIIAPASDCSRTIDDPEGDVLLLGDSTAWQLFPALAEAADSVHRDMTMAYLHACPTNRVQLRINGGEYPACQTFWSSVLRELEVDPPDVVVVSIALDRYLTAGTNDLLDVDGQYTSDPTRRAAIMRPALTDTMKELSTLVDDVIFVGITPKFDEWQPDECSFITWHFAADRCGRSRSWDELAPERAIALDIQQDIVAAADATLLDLDELICDIDGCSTNRGNAWIYRDYGHITTDESIRLAPAFATAISDVLEG